LAGGTFHMAALVAGSAATWSVSAAVNVAIWASVSMIQSRAPMAMSVTTSPLGGSAPGAGWSASLSIVSM
jgi:hypothetical protein